MSFKSDGSFISRKGTAGPSVTEFATVSELITASQGGLAEGYYEVPGVVLTKYDGANFDQPLSVIMDHLDDLAFWFTVGGKVNSSLEIPTIGEHVVRWEGKGTPAPIGASPTNVNLVLSKIGDRDSITMTSTYYTVINSPRGYVNGPFEVFATVQLADMVDTNAGLAGTWNGSNGWLLGASDSSSPFGVRFGFNGTWARASERLNTSPHVVHGRYTGAEVIVSLDGVDLDTQAKTGTQSNLAALGIGAYQASNAVTAITGKMADFVKIDKLLTDDERAAIVSELMTAIGI